MKFIDIISRDAWGYRYGLGWNKRPVPAQHVILHHSETNTPSENASFDEDAAAVRYLDYIGWLRFNYADTGYTRPRGAGISYTWAVTPSGRVFQGHDITLTSSHTSGYNTSGVGICLVGNYMNTAPTKKQIEAVARLLLQAKEDGHIVRAKIDYGHKETSSTDCPGKAMESIPTINSHVNEILNPPVEDPNKGYSQEWIRKVQTDLQILSYYTGLVTGHLPDVDPALRQFQADYGLEADGLPGNQTAWALQVAMDEYNDTVLKEREIAAAIARVRISGSSRWATSELAAMTELPSGKGVLLAADGSPDERYATARAGGEVRYLPLRQANDSPPSSTIRALKNYQPEWIRVVGGQTVVTDNCVRRLLEELGII